MERVKLYWSKNEDDWEDKGTGYLKFESIDGSEKDGFVVMSEDNDTQLLTHEIGVTAQDYTLQEDSKIIRWSEPASEIHHALSFEHAAYCKETYGRFLKAMGQDSASGEKPLPELTIANLESVAKIFEDVPPFSRDQSFSQLRSSHLISQLVQVFQQCEDLEDLTGCEQCCRLARCLILHADFSTAETLFSEEHAMHIIGALEYDPDLTVRIKHRQFLKEKVIFKQVVPIEDPDTINKIHQIYRMQYVKDVVLPRLMDEPVFYCLSHMIMMGQMEVVHTLSTLPSFFSDLFAKIRDSDTQTQEWKDLVRFLQEYCLLLRQLQPANQQCILGKLYKLGLFIILTDALRDGTPDVKLKVIDILNSSMSQEPSALRHHVSQTDHHPLFKLLIDNLITGDEMGLTEHSLEVIKALLDPTDEARSKYEEFLGVFYGNFINHLVDALAVGMEGKDLSMELPGHVSARAKGSILDLLCFCVQTHAYNMKYSILRGNILDRVLGLLKAPEKWLVISAVRFVRTLIGMKEDFYDQFVVRQNAIGRVIDVFFENGDRNNLLNSTILELFDFLKKERRHQLIQHIVEQFYDQLKDVDYVSTFEDLKMEFDKKQEAGVSLEDTSMLSANATRMKRDSRSMEKEEEEYFAEGSDDTEKMPDITSSSGMEVEDENDQNDEHPSKRLRSDEATTVSFQREQQQET